jgi:hypothetical protein
MDRKGSQHLLKNSKQNVRAAQRIEMMCFLPHGGSVKINSL